MVRSRRPSRAIALAGPIWIAIVCAGCGDEPRFEHFVYHFDANDPDYSNDLVAVLEGHFSTVHERCALSTAGPPIGYWKYRTDDLSEINRRCVRGTRTACADKGSVLTTLPAHFHEVFHAYLYTASQAIAPSFINEGLAQITSCDPGARSDLQAVLWPELAYWTAGLDDQKDRILYDAASALTASLTARFGLPKVTEFAIEVARDPNSRDVHARRSFGDSLEQLWQQTLSGPRVIGSCLPSSQCASAPAISLDDAPRGGLWIRGQEAWAAFTLADARPATITAPGCSLLDVISCEGRLAILGLGLGAADAFVADLPADRYLVRCRELGVGPAVAPSFRVQRAARSPLSSSCAAAIADPTHPPPPPAVPSLGLTSPDALVVGVSLGTGETSYLGVIADNGLVVVEGMKARLCGSCAEPVDSCLQLDGSADMASTAFSGTKVLVVASPRSPATGFGFLRLAAF